MKQFKICLVIIVLAFTAACSKGGDTPTPTPIPPVVTPVAEPDVTFNIEIAGAVIDYTTYFAALGATQAINVNITSTFPKDGVTIQVVVTNETTSAELYNETKAGTAAATNPFTIANLLSGVPCSGKVTVTSKTLDPVSKTYKSLQKSFKISRK